MASIITIIEARIKEHPGKRLFAFLDSKGTITESYTYADFEEKTATIAAHIHSNYQLSPGDRVLLAYPPGLEMIWAFFACVKLGLIPVPVYPPSAQGLEASVQKMNFIATDCGARAVLTSRSCYWSYKINVSRHSAFVSVLQWIVSDDALPVSAFHFPEVGQEILFLQYTSGSTSDPKGVMVTHANLIENCTNVVDHVPVGVSWLPQYHDMGLIGYYLFFALKGGTTYGIAPADFIQRPALWLEAISRYRATASSAPNFAYDYCLMPGKIPEDVMSSLDLSSLKFLMTAAEPIRPAVYKAFLQKFKPAGLLPESFFGAYGLAEFTLAVTNYGRRSLAVCTESLKTKQVKLYKAGGGDQHVTELMSCGKALNNTLIKIVDPDGGNTEVEEGAIGEIWLDGASKCKGYWNREALTTEVFEAALKSGSADNTWLRTGDLGFLYEGELYVCGRIKDLIILRGLNYYPQDIEALVEEEPEIRKGCVVAFADERLDDQSLIIVAGLKSRSKMPGADSIRLRIQQYLGLPVSEIVFVPARAISKTSSGKIRRYETKKNYLTGQLQIISRCFPGDLAPEENHIQPAMENSVDNPENARSLFQRYKLSGREHAALGDAGLDSMRLAEFGHDLKAYLTAKGFEDLSEEVDLKLLQRIAVSELFSILEELHSASYFARLKFRKAFLGIRNAYETAETSLMQRDAASTGMEEQKTELSAAANDSGSCLLTGGTGFFGPFLVYSLLEQTPGDIYVLVRAGSSLEGMERLLQAYGSIKPSVAAIASFKKRVKPLCGDLAKPSLGLCDEDWNFLCHDLRCIYHNGAYVNYLADYESMRAINVNGTKEVIRLAMSVRPKELNHISTTFIFGWSVKDTLFESDCNAAMEFLDFGYSQSKWVSDQLVLKAMEQGLRARIFRPALISPSVNGDGYNFDISIRLLAFMLKYGISTHAQNQVSFTPADIAANNMVAISGIPASLGQTFHVTRDAYSGMHDVTQILGALAGQSFENYDLKAFVPEVVSRCKKEDLLFPLLNFLVKSVDNISAMEFKRYDNSNYQKFRSLSPWGKADPPLEEVVRGMYLFMKNNAEISGSLPAEHLALIQTNTHGSSGSQY